jgi:hypothetical protein
MRWRDSWREKKREMNRQDAKDARGREQRFFCSEVEPSEPNLALCLFGGLGVLAVKSLSSGA